MAVGSVRHAVPGGNADLYGLYNPCTDTVEYVSVGSTHITLIDEVSCADL